MWVGGHCVSCGGVLPEGASFCPQCGAAVISADAGGVGPSAAPRAEGGFDAQGAEAVPSAAAPMGWQAPPSTTIPPPPVSELPSPPDPRATTKRLVTSVLLASLGALVLLCGIGGGVWWWLGKPDRDYIGDLRASGDLASFSSEAEAIAHGKRVCADLSAGGKAQGTRIDLAATKAYCSRFSGGFHVLETKIIEGTFTLIDTSYSPYYTSIDTSGFGCEGAGGYSDIRTGTAVTVKNAAGILLGSAQLAAGSGDSSSCTFAFSVNLTEGEDDYVVSVSHRGDMHYTWSQLSTGGIRLSLGS